MNILNKNEVPDNSEKKKRTAAIILAAGSGKRMGSSTKKQYLMLADQPVMYYALKVFQDSFIDELVLVVSPGDIDYCQREIVDFYGFNKVSHIVEGGQERYHSVMAGLEKVGSCEYVFIHDSARPFIKEEILLRAYDYVQECDACVVGVPTKDTVKIADENNNIVDTPDRKLVWQVQTPQVFKYTLIKEAYEQLARKESALLQQGISITDDAMVVEKLTGHPVKLVLGSYDNIKITTPEDLQIGACFLD